MTGTRWSERQIKQLEFLWPSDLSRDKISLEIGKSSKAIRVKASRLNIKRHNRIWTEEGLKRRRESTSKQFKGKKQGPNRKKVIQTEEAKRNARNGIRNNPNELKRRGDFIRNYNLTRKDYSTPWNKGTRGEETSNWRGGISFEPYCIKFDTSYKRRIRNLFGNECFLCGLSEADNGRKLDVHHVNYNKRLRLR